MWCCKLSVDFSTCNECMCTHLDTRRHFQCSLVYMRSWSCQVGWCILHSRHSCVFLVCTHQCLLGMKCWKLLFRTHYYVDYCSLILFPKPFTKIRLQYVYYVVCKLSVDFSTCNECMCTHLDTRRHFQCSLVCMRSWSCQVGWCILRSRHSCVFLVCTHQCLSGINCWKWSHCTDYNSIHLLFPCPAHHTCTYNYVYNQRRYDMHEFIGLVTCKIQQ